MSLARIGFSLTQLEYVLAVHKHGHFAKAAKACYITQPTLSMQIQKLEEDLGVVIFDRTKKPILLTPMGLQLIEQIKSVLFEAKKIEAITQHSAHGPAQGELTLGIIPTIAPYLLPRLLPVLEKRFPDLHLVIKELQTHRIIEALDTDEIDAGILATPLKISRILEIPLYYEPFSVLCQKGHELGKEKKARYSELKAGDLWLLEEGHCLRYQILDICSIRNTKSKKRRFTFESGNLETLKNLVNSAGGYTLLPALATDHIGDHAQLIPFDRPIPAREIGLAYRREQYKMDLIEALGEAIIESIPEEIRKIRKKDLEVFPMGPNK